MTNLTNSRDCNPGDAGYWSEMREGFAQIREIERCLKERDSYLGRYSWVLNHETEDYEVYEESDEDYTWAHDHAVELAKVATEGRALTIIKAQGRTDEPARLILRASWTDDEKVKREQLLDYEFGHAEIDKAIARGWTLDGLIELQRTHGF